MPASKQLKKDGELFVWGFLGVLIVTLCVSWTMFTIYVANLEASSEGSSLIDYINASTQRLVKLEYMGNTSDEIIFNLDNTITEITPALGEKSEYFGNDSDILKEINDVAVDWEVMKTAIEEYRIDGDETSLNSSSERFFYHAASLSILTTDYISDLSAKIVQMQFVILLQIALVVLVVGHRLFMTLMELKRNKELSESMFIDSATGLFNRSKCHEILRVPTDGDGKSRAMIVFDLNDLKKTNDKYGHRVGDELIYTCAKLIKDGTKVHTKDAFVGRYGGDEFMVYYSSVDEAEVKLYLSEVAFLTEAFNEKETRFQVSYAVGYAMSSSSEKTISLRNLFDVADNAMYINKAEMKRKKAQAQKLEEEGK